MVKFIFSKLKSTTLELMASATWLRNMKGKTLPITPPSQATYYGVSQKGEEAPAHAVITDVAFVHPVETRPLAIKRRDNKHVAATLNFCISPAVGTGAIDTQRGLIRGRRLIQNVVDLDHFGRKFVFEHR